MKKKLLIVTIAVLLCAMAAGAWYQAKQDQYHATYVVIEGREYLRTTEELDLSGKALPDPAAYTVLTALKRLDLRGTGIRCEDYEAVRAALPECEILWDVPFGQGTLPNTIEALTIDALTAEDRARLAYFPALDTVYANTCRDYDQLAALIREHPDWNISYTVPLGGRYYPRDTKSVTLRDADLEEMAKWLPLLPEVTNVTLEGQLPEGKQLRELVDSMPEITFYWQLEVMGVPVDTNTESLDLSGQRMTVADLEPWLTYLPGLTFVDMSFCGISYDEMDAFNRRWEDIKIVWTVSLGGKMWLRTDATWFMPIKYDVVVNNWDVYNLRYCTDMIALDIGHMGVSDCSFVAFMPKLKYLLLGDTPVKDITPLTGLTELVYLELFLTRVEDYTPLLTLTALEDLNLHYTDGDVNIIAKMTWLKNLWWSNNEQFWLTEEERQFLRESLPNTYCEFDVHSSTGAGWRQLPNYFAQRDIFGMHYMT